MDVYTGVTPNPVDTGRIFAAGEMADLTRAFDWSKTPVGPIDHWSETLLTHVNTILASRHPMFLWWGEDLVQFYNDAYRPSIRDDKHPQALGQKGTECWTEIWPIIGPQIDAVMSRGESTWHEDQLVPIYRNGRIEDVYWTYGYSPVRDATGKIRGTLVVCTETTDSVVGRQQLQRERMRLSDIFEQAPTFFAVLGGPSHIFEMINPLYQDLVGDRGVLGKSVLEAVPESEEQGFIAILDKVYQTGVPFVGHNFPIKLNRRGSSSSELRYLNFVYQPRLDPNGRTSGVIVVGVDVTEGRRSEQLLQQSEKLAAVGRLASSMAHEINNPLEAVTNLLFLAQRFNGQPEVGDFLDKADLELRRVAAIVNQTLRFHRQSTPRQMVTAEKLFESAIELYKARIINSRLEIDRRYRTEVSFRCFSGEIRQVLSNLIGNAIDATAPWGRLQLRSRLGVNWMTGRSGIVLTIADSGAGMSQETAARIFEPFFSTKGINGTGLGMWICREIVDRHQGSLRFKSSQSPRRHGTVFELFLPFEVSQESGR